MCRGLLRPLVPDSLRRLTLTADLQRYRRKEWTDAQVRAFKGDFKPVQWTSFLC